MVMRGDPITAVTALDRRGVGARIFAGVVGLSIGFGGTDLLVGNGAASSQPLAAVAPASAAQEVLYRNCAAVRAAGAAAIRRGEPGYGPHLDRDGDGVGCE